MADNLENEINEAGKKLNGLSSDLNGLIGQMNGFLKPASTKKIRIKGKPATAHLYDQGRVMIEFENHDDVKILFK